MKYINVLIMLLVSLASASVPAAAQLTPDAFGFEAQNKATATVSVTLQVEAGGVVDYSYIVRNNELSQKPIENFSLQVDVAPGPGLSRTPPKWDGPNCCKSDVVRMSSTGMRAVTWLYIDDDNLLLPPGGTVSGFGMKAQGVPTIRRFFVQSYTPNSIPQGEPGSEDEAKAIDELWDFFNNSTSGFTIGPSTTALSLDNRGLVDNLITLKHQSADIGWLGNAKFVEKLDKRLDQAKAAIARDKKKLARVRLTQFVHELEKAHKERGRDRDDDRHGKDKGKHHDKKFVNDEAFQLLKINAEFIIARLPTKGKDRDEEDECRRAENEKDDDRDDQGKKDDDRRGGREHDR